MLKTSLNTSQSQPAFGYRWNKPKFPPKEMRWRSANGNSSSQQGVVRQISTAGKELQIRAAQKIASFWDIRI